MEIVLWLLCVLCGVLSGVVTWLCFERDRLKDRINSVESDMLANHAADCADLQLGIDNIAAELAEFKRHAATEDQLSELKVKVSHGLGSVTNRVFSNGR